MPQEDNIFNTFDKGLYRVGSPVYEGDGNPISDISTIQQSNLGDGYANGSVEVVNNNLQSGKFLTGVSGWSIDADGNAEFNNGTFRGDVEIGTPGGAEVVISGNDINLYDASVGGTTPVTGNTASINFIRASDHSRQFTIQKRASTASNNDDVFELFSTVPAVNRYNYIFIGRAGDQNESDWNVNSISTAINWKSSEAASTGNGFYKVEFSKTNVANNSHLVIGDTRTVIPGQTGGISTELSSDGGACFLTAYGTGAGLNVSGIAFANTATITNVSLTSNVVTITCNNSFLGGVGLTAALSGLTTSTFLNGQTLTITTASATQFTASFTHADVGSHADTGIAQGASASGYYQNAGNQVALGLNMIPDTDNAYDIGSTSFQIKDLYIGGSIHGGGGYSGSQFFECIPMTMNDPTIVNGAWSGSNGAGASSAVLGAYSQLNCGTGQGAMLFSQANYYNLFETAKTLTIDWQLLGISSIADGEIYLQLINTQSSTSTTVAQVTFLIFKGQISGICADGAAGTNTSQLGSTLSAGDQRTRLRAVITPGTNCKFYVNDVLQGTLTTNIPATSSPYIQIWAHSTAATDRRFKVGRIIITKDY